MEQRLEQLEIISRQLEPDKSQRDELFQQAKNYAYDFMEHLPGAPGYTQSTLNQISSLSIEESGKPVEQLLTILKEEVDTKGINSASGRHLGYIPGGGIWTSAIADLLAAVANRYAGIAYSSPGAVAIENQMIRWMCSLVGYPSSAHGNLSSGGSIANLVAIKTARDFHKVNSKIVTKSVVYLTNQTHHCINKALDTTGLQEAVIRRIPMDNRFRLDVEALQQQVIRDEKQGLNPFLVVATAGTTDTGAVDPLDEIADICDEHAIWFHVDAAYGGFFLLVDEMKKTFKGIERSDSVVMDPHKTLFVPYGSGVVLVKNRDALLYSHAGEAAYMKDSYGQNQINPADTGPELSKHFRGLRMWLPLHLHGVEPFRANLEEKLLLCRYFHEEIKTMGFKTGPEPELSITYFRYPEDESNIRTKKLIDALHKDGRFFFSSTVMDEKLWIRCAVVSFRTHLREIKLALKMIRQVDSIIGR